ncbi:MAG: hypothetical protein E4H40_03620 [Candidatus Brocadiia bacterium]|nr:MAG: hypothetical protein E4H40_03620 [Candidatus Brocadiia bacterium]
MPVDTRDKRAAAGGTPLYPSYPQPDGAIDASDRSQAAGVYPSEESTAGTGSVIMEIRRTKNTACYVPIPMVSTSAPAGFKTGLSPADTAYCKDGSGPWTALAIADAFAEIGATGMYEIALTAAEMNHDQLIIKVTAPGAADVMAVIDCVKSLAEKMLANKAVQDKLTGAIVYYDDDGVTPVLTHSPVETCSEIERAVS